MFIISTILFLLSQLVQHTTYSDAFIRSYVDDLLFFPLSLSAIVEWKQLVSNVHYFIKWQHILAGVFFISILFEVILPKVNHHCTSDITDVICYIVGATLFYVFQKIKRKRSQPRNLRAFFGCFPLRSSQSQ
jgi:glycopeptide antibiotics resistance protein